MFGNLGPVLLKNLVAEWVDLDLEAALEAGAVEA